MSNHHPYNPAPEVPYQYYQSSNTLPVADSNSYTSNAPRAPCQVPGETKPDPNPPPDWPTRPKQTTHPALTDGIDPLHASPIDPLSAYEHPPTAITPNPYERAYSAHTTQHGITESNPQAGAGYIPQQPMAQYSSAPGASMTASWSSHQSSSTTSSGHSGRDTSSRYGRRDNDNKSSRISPTQEANALQDSIWIWSAEYGRYYRWCTNEQGQRAVVWS